MAKQPSSLLLRRAMVRSLEHAGALRSNLVRRAFLDVPRELFVPEIAARDGLAAVYRPEVALVTATDDRGEALSSSSAPVMMALMLEALDLKPGLRVLEVGAGTGYNAALLAQLVGETGRVVSVDVERAFARRAGQALAQLGFRCRVVVGDGRAGWRSGAPFDRIIVTASARQVSRSWHDQLADGGLVEVPLRIVPGPFPQSIVTFRRQGDRLRSIKVIAGFFMPLRGPGWVDLVEPSLRVVARGAQPTTLASLTGAPIGALSDVARQRALATISGPSRGAMTLSATAARGLMMFLAWGATPGLVACTPAQGRYGVGVVTRSGESVAALTVARGGAGRIDVWGDIGGLDELERRVREWEALGRPGLEDAQLTVTYDGNRAWRAWRHFDGTEGVLSVAWATG